MKNKVWTEIILNDIHIPKQNKKALNCVFKVIQKVKPDGITLNGDIGDWGTFSRHDITKFPKKNWTDSQFYDDSLKSYTELNEFLDRIDKTHKFKKKNWLHGNHEVWVDSFIQESPQTRRQLFDIAQRLDLVKRGYKITKYNDFINLGKLKVTHGIYTGQHHAKKHVDMMGSSILYGHVHDLQTYSKTTPDKISHMAWSNGCLCDLNPCYLRGRPQNWNHGFALVYVWPNRDFQVDIVRIQKGKCLIWGEEIKG